MPIVEGIALRYDTPMTPGESGLVVAVAPDAMVYSDLAKVKLLRDHETLIGQIRDLVSGPEALAFRAEIADSQDGRDAYALVKSGALVEASVGFSPLDADLREGMFLYVRRARLVEISLVPWGASPGTAVRAAEGEQPLGIEIPQKIAASERRRRAIAIAKSVVLHGGWTNAGIVRTARTTARGA
jgi:HK97 family phage prohead protease